MDAEALANQVFEAVKGYVARANAPIGTRLATVETRTAALAMLAARVGGVDVGKVAELESLLQRLKALEGLEARIKALEDAR